MKGSYVLGVGLLRSLHIKPSVKVFAILAHCTIKCKPQSSCTVGVLPSCKVKINLHFLYIVCLSRIYYHVKYILGQKMEQK